jgi:hypothetical protein
VFAELSYCNCFLQFAPSVKSCTGLLTAAANLQRETKHSNDNQLQSNSNTNGWSLIWASSVNDSFWTYQTLQAVSGSDNRNSGFEDYWHSACIFPDSSFSFSGQKSIIRCTTVPMCEQDSEKKHNFQVLHLPESFTTGSCRIDHGECIVQLQTSLNKQGNLFFPSASTCNELPPPPLALP